jgi:S1-C subfamily serine protease
VNRNPGVGFAIPTNTASSVAAQLIATGHAEHAWLGVRVEAIDRSIAKLVRGLPSKGVVVAHVVPGRPAAKAGLAGAMRQVTVNGVSALLGGDAIVAIDGKRISSAQQLADAIALRKPGERVDLRIVRGGRRRTVAVTLGNAPNGA